MAVKRLSPLRFSFIFIAALAAWVSAGALSVASSQPAAARVGVLPSGLWLALAIAIAVGAGVAFRPQWAALFSIAALILLPWLPVPVPPVFLIFAGHLRAWVWILIAVAAAAVFVRLHAPPPLAAAAADPRRAARLAGATAAALYLAGAYSVSPQLPAGDEPHYLVIAQSLLADRDLKVENNYQRADYLAYFGAPLRPDYLQRGKNGEIYSVHAPGLPALVAPVFAIFGYPGVVALLAILSGCATGLAWTAAWRVTGDIAAAWFGWAATALAMPFFFQSFVAYPDALGGAIVMIGVLTVIAGAGATVRRLAWTGAALALLPWLHMRLAVPAGTLGALIAIRQLGTHGWPRRAAALFAVPAISLVCWLAFFYAVYGTPDPRAPYGGTQQSALANVPRGLAGLLFDQQFGALPNAPVYLCAALGFVVLFRRRRRVAAELLALVAPYMLAVAAFEMWWGGTSSAARFLTPVLLPLAIPAAAWFQAARGRASRLLALGALAVSLLITVTIATVDRGALLYNARDGSSRLLLWLSPLVDLTTGMPSLFQNGPLTVTVQAIVWLAAIAVTALAGHAIASRTAGLATQATGIALAAAIASMIALSVVWRGNHATPVTPTTGNVALLRTFGASSRQMAIQYSPLRRLALSDLPPRLTLASYSSAGVPAVPDAPLISVPHPPAATYAIEVVLRHRGAGHVTIAVDRAFDPAWRWDLTDAHTFFRREFRLPVPAAVMLVDADSTARSAIERVAIRPVMPFSPQQRVTNAEPWHTSRYGTAVVFLMDGGRAYMEPGGIWVGGENFADVVVAPDQPKASVHLLVRNPPVDNEITLDAGVWHQSISFKPGEERTFEIPLPRERAALLVRVTSARGARPAEFEQGSTDTRLLGCWIETR